MYVCARPRSRGFEELLAKSTASDERRQSLDDALRIGGRVLLGVQLAMVSVALVGAAPARTGGVQTLWVAAVDAQDIFAITSSGGGAAPEGGRRADGWRAVAGDRRVRHMSGGLMGVPVVRQVAGGGRRRRWRAAGGE